MGGAKRNPGYKTLRGEAPDADGAQENNRLLTSLKAEPLSQLIAGQQRFWPGLSSLYSEKDSRVPLGHAVDLRFAEPVLLELLEIGQQPIGMNRVQHLPQVA